MASSSNEPSSAAEHLPSLQDLCKLNILCNINEFPVEVLSLLPQSMKRHLFKVAPLFDRLHFDNSLDFREEFGIEDLCLPSEEERRSGQTRVLYGDSNKMRDTLVECLLTNPRLSQNRVAKHAFKDGCCLSLTEAVNFLDCLSSHDDSHLEGLIRYIHRCNSYTVVVPPAQYYQLWSMDNGQRTATENIFEKYLVIPKHINEFLSVECIIDLKFSFTNITSFIAYCNLKPTPSHKVFSINTFQLLDSPMWNAYETIRENSITKLQQLQSPEPLSKRIKSAVNPIYPFLQRMLASVEHLNIGTGEDFDPAMEEEVFSIDAPFFILHNIVSQEQPNLKSIHVHGIANTVVETVQTVAAFLIGKDNSQVTGIMNDRYTESGHMYYLTPPINPYFIEKLEITAESAEYGFVKQYMTEYSSSVVSNTVKQIIEVQKSSIRCLSLKDLGFTYKNLDTSSELLESSSLGSEDLESVNSDDYCSLLQSTLPDFVRLPQFESLTLSESPDKECYNLLMAFLTTPASHDQNLTIKLRASKTAVPDWYKTYNVPTNLPESNNQFKSLDLEGEKSQLIKFIFSVPNLSLKSLDLLNTQSFSADILQTTVNIKCLTLHVTSCGIHDSKLDVSLSENQSLIKLTVSEYDHKSVFNAINKFLLRMIEKPNRKLDFVTLEGINLMKVFHNDAEPSFNPSASSSSSSTNISSHGLFVSNDEQGYDFTKWPSNLKVDDVSSVFSSIENPSGLGLATDTTPHDQSSHHMEDSICIPSYVTHKDIFMFFLLIQKLNAITLTITNRPIYIDPDTLQKNLIYPLERAQIRVKKIILMGFIKNYKEEFNRIAEVVDVV